MHSPRSSGQERDQNSFIDSFFPSLQICRDANRISTRFFFVVKNMSRCVKYQGPGGGVGVGFCHRYHSVKMRQKHQGLLEYARGPTHNVQTDTSLVLDYTYQWGPSVSNDFSNLNNSLSPTPKLQYTRNGTRQYAYSKCTCLNKLVSRYTTRMRAPEESWTLRDSYCVEKHF